MDISIIAALTGAAIGTIATVILTIIIYKLYYKQRITLQNKQLDAQNKQLELYGKQLNYITLSNLAPIVQVERSIGDITTNAFRFHGIQDEDIDELERSGITKQELAYLVASFTAGRIYDTCVLPKSDQDKLLNTTHYRYKMLEQKDTIKAWPFIKKMMTENEYIERLDKIVSGIKKDKGL